MANTPGRNDPCPCGSGKKYKHCCLAAADRQAEAQSAGHAGAVARALAWLTQRHRKAVQAAMDQAMHRLIDEAGEPRPPPRAQFALGIPQWPEIGGFQVLAQIALKRQAVRVSARAVLRDDRFAAAGGLAQASPQANMQAQRAGFI